MNCIVFNAKDDSGYINYDSKVKLAQDSGAKLVLYDIDFIPNFANIIKEQPHKKLLYFFYNELLINGIGEQFMV